MNQQPSCVAHESCKLHVGDASFIKKVFAKFRRQFLCIYKCTVQYQACVYRHGPARAYGRSHLSCLYLAMYDWHCTNNNNCTESDPKSAVPKVRMQFCRASQRAYGSSSPVPRLDSCEVNGHGRALGRAWERGYGSGTHKQRECSLTKTFIK